MKIHQMPQRSDDWFAVRVGKITATSFATMANGRDATIETLCLKTAAEIITGQAGEKLYINAAMQHGIDTEEQAKAAYSIANLCHVQEVGFIELNEYIGCSPDGLIDDDGGLEIKCPETHTHLTYLNEKGNAWKAYKWQVQGALWITGREYWDFVSFCPAFSKRRLLIERVLPDLKCFEMLQAGSEFCINRIKKIIEVYHDNIA
ncbi:MAG: lambda exonuclease family protein [Syntrophorhabdaceae bacterium]